MENRNCTAISSCIPACGIFAADDAATRKRKELAEKLKRGEKVNTTPSGEVAGANSSTSALLAASIISAHTIALLSAMIFDFLVCFSVMLMLGSMRSHSKS